MPVRDRILRAIVLFGAALLFITETLSAFNALSRGPLIAAWLVVIAVALMFSKPWDIRTWPRLHGAAQARDPIILLCAAGIVTILTLTSVTAAFSPPNSADAMAYHMPRVVYWAEQSSVRFFPTGYMAQLMLQPLAEYLMLHTYILSGGDHLINFVQWFSSLGCMAGVSAIAGCLGAKPRGQWIAAFFCATLPSGILASSGAKNDYFMACWLVAAIYFAFRLTKSAGWIDALFLGAACGLALYTKATAYLFAPWIIIAVLAQAPRRVIRVAIAAGALALVINTPHYVRNYTLSGSIMGFESVQADSNFRFRNDTLGWKQTVSNILRNTSEQLGGRSERWNTAVFRFVERAHQVLGIDIADPATTWQWTSFHAPRNANHEADAPNRLHLLILCALGCLLPIRASRGHDRQRALYGAAIALGFVVFCAWLKWQPFMARLFLPLFVVASPLAGVLEEVLSPAILQAAVCLLLIDGARLPVLENWVRPLRGPGSVLRGDRDSQYFADMTQWSNTASYRETVQQLSSSKCGVIGIDLSHYHLEYPLQALLRERNPNVLFVHAGVSNASARYRQPISAPPCAIVCLECAGDTRHLSVYKDFAVSTTAGKFVISSH